MTETPDIVPREDKELIEAFASTFPLVLKPIALEMGQRCYRLGRIQGRIEGVEQLASRLEAALNPQ